mgnify:CR=1 FL=1
MNPNDPLKLTVLDEDVTTEDIVGSASIDLHEKGLLDASGWKEHNIEIQFEGKKAGDLLIKTRYIEIKWYDDSPKVNIKM